MRHQVQTKKFNRDHNARKALFLSLSKALVEREQIKTTLPKAKALRTFIEPMVTRAKVDSVANRRLLAADLGNDQELVKKMFKVIGPRYASRPGGYTRVLKAGFRYGDAAPMAIIEFIDRDVSAKGAKVKIEKDGTVKEAVKKETTRKAPAAKVDMKTSASAVGVGRSAAKGTKEVAVKRRATGK